MKNLALGGTTLVLVGALGACSGAREGGGSGGAGGAPLASGGLGGGSSVQACATGGSIYLSACEVWLGGTGGRSPSDPETLPRTCGGVGGEGGDVSAFVPTLRRVCEAPTEPRLGDDHPLYHCLKALAENPCADGHDAAVRDCLSKAPRDENCTPTEVVTECRGIAGACSGVSLELCAPAFLTATRPEVLRDCFAEVRDGESCEARFVRCAWDL